MITYSDLCIGMHVGLRRGCDSKITSLAWNLIQLMPNDPWIHYGEQVLKFYPETQDWLQAAKTALEQYRKLSYAGFWHRDIRPSPDTDETYWERCLYLTMEQFQEEDWKGMMAIFTNPTKRDVD